MIVIEYQVGVRVAKPVAFTATPLRDATNGTVPRSAATDDGFPRIFAQAGGTSRLDGAVGTQKFRERWRADVDQAIEPALVLRGGDRILVQGSNRWQLFDLSGKPISTDRFGSGGAVIDARPGMFYVVDRNGFLSAHGLADGAVRFELPLAGNEGVSRPLVVREGARLLAVGVEQNFFPHRPKPASRSMIELFKISSPIKVSDSKDLESVEPTERLYFSSSDIKAAVAGESMVVAAPGAIFFVGTDLKIANVYSANFEPLWMSVDEAHRVHLVVKESDGGLALWVVTKTGERTARTPLAPDRGALIAPPIIGYDHRIYLVTRDVIAAYSAEGKPLWDRRANAPIVGAAIATDDRLLASVGDALVAYEPSGAWNVVHSFAGDVLRTPPAMANGEIVVASSRRVYAVAKP